MPDSISSLATRNFDNANLIRQEDVGELMNKEGRFTLDDAGKLTVINHPTRRDGKVTRFLRACLALRIEPNSACWTVWRFWNET